MICNARRQRLRCGCDEIGVPDGACHRGVEGDPRLHQRDRVEALEAFINRFRATATKAKQVQSRIKELEKIERIEIPPDEQTIHFSFPQPKQFAL